MTSKVHRYLRKRGTAPEEIDRAAAEGWLPLLVVDRMLAPGRRQYTLDDVAEQASTDVATVRRLWRALGFPDFPEGVAAFTDDDVDAVKLALERAEARMGFEGFVELARVASVTLNRLAVVETDGITEAIAELRATGATEEEVAGAVGELIDWPALSQLVDYGHRVLLRAALWRRLARGGAPRTELRDVAVGFVDLVGYTALTERATRVELHALLDRFEGLVYDTVAERGGRVVKTIGDEVMFVSADPFIAVDTALALVDATTADDLVPPARAGIAFGEVLARDGDYYGRVVNLASRLVNTARRGSVHTGEAVHDALGEVAGLSWRKLRRRRLRDIGLVPLWQVERGESEEPEAE